jgi:hypothetical protein
MTITNGNGDPLGTAATPPPATPPTEPTQEPPTTTEPPNDTGGIVFLHPDFWGINITFGN